MMKKRNCNMDLRLIPRSIDYDTVHDKEEENDAGDKQQLTIFYNGRVAVCDATELQARAIIWLASREAEESPNGSTRSGPESPLLASSLYSPTTGMKRSLKSFLQTRKTRVQATTRSRNPN